MSVGAVRRGSADRRVLDEAGSLRAMTWVMAIMVLGCNAE